MGSVNIDLSILCVCGQPGNAPVHQGGGHAYQPVRGAGQRRDDQRTEDGPRPGHYALSEQRIITVGAPAAGADWSATVPTPARWRVNALQAQLTTGAAGGNRVPHLVITDGQGHSVYNFPSTANQLANSTAQYSAGATVMTAQFDNAQVLVLPYPLKLLQTWTIGTLTTGIQAGDQWSNIVLYVKEWLDF
jgi:hypothetical protein